MSLLRKHVWQAHREVAGGLKAEKQIVLKTQPHSEQVKEPLLATDLLAKLEEQHTLLGNMIALIKGILSQ